MVGLKIQIITRWLFTKGSMLILTFCCSVGFVAAQTIAVGAGSYSGGNTEPSFTPKITSSLTGKKIPTNDWWTSLIWGYHSGSFSGELYADPLSCMTVASGLSIRRQTNPAIDSEHYNYDNAYGMTTDFTVGLSGLNASGTKVDAFSDWNVTSNWDDGVNKMNAIIGHGSPYLYFNRLGGAGSAEVDFNTAPSAVWGSGNAYGVTVNGSNYGIFSPTGTSWTGVGTATWTVNLSGKNYFTICALPDGDASLSILNFYKAHAFAFVTNSLITYTYNSNSAQLTTTYSATVTSQGSENQPTTLLALYRHQWLYSTVNTAYQYALNARGVMKVVEGNSFTTTMTFNGVLPTLPKYKRESVYQTNLTNFINAAIAGPPGNDSYNSGKWLGRLAQLLQLADPSQQNQAAKYSSFLNSLKSELQDWFTAGSAKEFRYNATYGALSPPSDTYGERSQLNDHHFHYGYFIHAAAIVARYDQAWASSAQWGGMVELLIQDVANWDPTTNTLFPKLKHFDPYAGHSWANGHGDNWAGNDQESSSEAMNCWTGLILWGSNTGNTAIRDLGIYLYTTELAAIEQYWFDINNTVHPSGYTPPYICRIDGNGGIHTLFFAGGENEKFGINLIPITGGSLYLGRNPSYTNTSFAWMNANGGNSSNGNWKEFFWSMQAMNQASLNPTFNSAASISSFGTGSYTPEVGDSKPRTYHWISNLDTLGQLNLSVTCDIPTYAVFDKGCNRTHVAYNPTPNATKLVTFSDGSSLSVAPNEIGYVVSNSCGPSANFTSSATAACTATTITFTNTSTNTTGSTTYTWNFGAGATPATANTAGPHAVSYASAGLKTISLSLDGQSSGAKFKSSVITINSCVTSADFSMSNSVACIGDQIVFSNTSAFTNGSTTYHWDFGPNATPATANSSGPHLVTYTTAGTKTVSLSLDGQTSGLKYKTYSLDILPTCSFHADFISDVSTVTLGQTVNFSNASTGLMGNESYSWNFGSDASLPPGTTGAGPYAAVYATTGVKTVSLTVSRPGISDTETKTFYISVNAPASSCLYSEEFESSTIVSSFVTTTQFQKSFQSGTPTRLNVINTNFGTFDFFKYVFNNGSIPTSLTLTSANPAISVRIKANVNHAMKVMFEDNAGIRTEGATGANPDAINSINVTTTYQTFVIPYSTSQLVNTNGGGFFNSANVTGIVFIGGSSVTYDIDWIGIGLPCSQLVLPTGPTLTSFTPGFGGIGSSVTLNGTGLTGATNVYLNGTEITGYVINGTGTQIQLTIPAGATSGRFSIVTPNGQASTFDIFQVTISLPIEIISFIGTKQEAGVLLHWKTTTSSSGNNFEIERSNNGIQYTKIGTVAFINSGTMASFQFEDVNPSDELLYYRLKCLDSKGSFTYSHAIAVDNDHLNKLLTYPVPFSDHFYVHLGDGGEESAQIKLVNCLGVEVYTNEDPISSRLKISTCDLPDGLYFLYIIMDNTVNQIPVIKSR